MKRLDLDADWLAVDVCLAAQGQDGEIALSAICTVWSLQLIGSAPISVGIKTPINP